MNYIISTSKSNSKKPIFNILPCEMIILMARDFFQFEPQWYGSSSLNDDVSNCLIFKQIFP